MFVYFLRICVCVKVDYVTLLLEDSIVLCKCTDCTVYTAYYSVCIQCTICILNLFIDHYTPSIVVYDLFYINFSNYKLCLKYFECPFSLNNMRFTFKS